MVIFHSYLYVYQRVRVPLEVYTGSGGSMGFLHFPNHRRWPAGTLDRRGTGQVESPESPSPSPKANSANWLVKHFGNTATPGEYLNIWIVSINVNIWLVTGMGWSIWVFFMITGWWFGTWMDYFPFHIWDVIPTPLTFTPSFFRGFGGSTTNQNKQSPGETRLL